MVVVVVLPTRKFTSVVEWTGFTLPMQWSTDATLGWDTAPPVRRMSETNWIALGRKCWSKWYRQDFVRELCNCPHLSNWRCQWAMNGRKCDRSIDFPSACQKSVQSYETIRHCQWYCWEPRSSMLNYGPIQLRYSASTPWSIEAHWWILTDRRTSLDQDHFRCHTQWYFAVTTDRAEFQIGRQWNWLVKRLFCLWRTKWRPSYSDFLFGFEEWPGRSFRFVWERLSMVHRSALVWQMPVFVEDRKLFDWFQWTQLYSKTNRHEHHGESIRKERFETHRFLTCA